MIVRVTDQWGKILQQDRFPNATHASVNVDARSFRKLFDGQTTSITVLLNNPLLRIEILPDTDAHDLSAPAVVPADCPWCTGVYMDLDKHYRVCPERLGPQDTARLRLVRGS